MAYRCKAFHCKLNHIDPLLESIYNNKNKVNIDSLPYLKIRIQFNITNTESIKLLS